MLITFSGLDGTGKSTQAQFAARCLAQYGYRTKIIHITQWTWVYRLGEWLAKRRSPAANQILSADGQSAPAAVYKWVRQFVSLLDVARFYGVVFYHRYVRRSVLICDRYFYDLGIQAVFTGVMNEHRARDYWRLAPRPQLALFFDLDPTIAQQREGEHELAYYEEKRRLYLKYAVQWPVFVVTTNELAETQATLSALLQKWMNTHGR